ncbi:MAG: hypothetical protein DWP92_01260 [Armatimonadetes bacterium]|nr:MAG: hypothetical protein DWP92_01260 [Armatimonadota bacterium]
MSERTVTFDVEGSPAIDISSYNGDIVVREGTNPRVTVVLSGSDKAVEAVAIEASADHVAIVAKQLKGRLFTKGVDIVVTAPAEGSLKINTGAGSVRVRLPMSDVAIRAASGEVRIDRPVGELTLHVASGDSYISDVHGEATIESASGDVRLRSAKYLQIKSASGDVRVQEVGRTARIKSASGDVIVRRFAGSDLEVSTMSGDIRLGLVSGMEVKASIKTLSGTIRNKITPTPGDRVGTMSLEVSSFSGDVTLRNASDPLRSEPTPDPAGPSEGSPEH